MMYIAGYNEGQTVAGASFLYRFLFYDFQLFHQFLYMGEVGVILEPANELGALFWSDAVDAGKLIVKHAEAGGLYQFFYRITLDEFFCHIASAERNVEGIEQMAAICLATLSYAFQHVGNALLSKTIPGCYLVGIVVEVIEVSVFADQSFIYQLPDGLF